MNKYATTKAYGDCTGPFGFAMQSRTAKAVEAALREQPRELRDRFKTAVGGQDVAGFARRVMVPKGMDLVVGEQADVSIITADGVDHDGEVVLPGGGVFDTFRANPVVPWCHDYEIPPVGRAEWITAAKVGDGGQGLKAKTRYTPRPKTHPAGVEWVPETIAGQPFPIAELNLYDRADLQRADRALHRDRLVEDCRTIGATQGETYQELDAFRDRRWGDAEWAALANGTDGKIAILERALEKANKGRGRELVAAIRWGRGPLLDVVALVAGLEVNDSVGGDGDGAGGDEAGVDPADPPTGRPGPARTM